MSRLKLVVAAGAALAFSTPASATDFIDDWEDTDFGSGPGFTIVQTYSGWNNTTGLPGSGIEIQFNNVAGVAHSGENLVELDSNINSKMTYGTPLDAGAYTLSFWYSDRPNVGAASNGIDVLLNAGSILSVVGGNGGGTTDWTQKTVNFTANAGDTLSFAALDAGAYTLSFWYSDRPNVAAASNGIDVLLNAASILSVIGGNGGGTTNWTLQTVNFTANAGDTLSFAALGNSDSLGGYIDDLQLSAAVPEPATWAMLILGFGAIGGVFRRRRRSEVRIRFT